MKIRIGTFLNFHWTKFDGIEFPLLNLKRSIECKQKLKEFEMTKLSKAFFSVLVRSNHKMLIQIRNKFRKKIQTKVKFLFDLWCGWRSTNQTNGHNMAILHYTKWPFPIQFDILFSYLFIYFTESISLMRVSVCFKAIVMECIRWNHSALLMLFSLYQLNATSEKRNGKRPTETQIEDRERERKREWCNSKIEVDYGRSGLADVSNLLYTIRLYVTNPSQTKHTRLTCLQRMKSL